MSKKNLSIVFILFALIISILFISPNEEMHKVLFVESPVEIVLDNQKISIEGLDCFDATFSDKNKKLAKALGISEEDAFIIGNLGKYWADNLLKGRKIYITKDDDIIYFKYSYRTKFMYSGFCLKNGKPFYKESFDKRLQDIQKGNYKVLDMNTDTIYDINDRSIRKLDNFLVIRKSHLPRHMKINNADSVSSIIDKGSIRIYFADSTSKLKPDRGCSSDICKEILDNINNSRSTIDIAIYGYSRTPKIEEALQSAIKRGVKIRLVYDSDINGNNIYPDTSIITKLLPDNSSDRLSAEAKRIMHNKFYIFDDKILITGSANLSHTDMSGFNTNSMIVVKSAEAAKIYKQEFEQMYRGKFHNEKEKINKNRIVLGDSYLDIYFSPQDKALANAVIPLINNAKEYIYIPTFVLTDKRVTEALINAKKRGVDIKVIIDALNASVQHSKHKELRQGGIAVKTENYAGKMHSKSMVVDDKYTIIGSMNFSNSGENRNDENLVLISDPVISKQYKNIFVHQWNKIDNKWLVLNARAEGKDSIGSCSDGLDNNYDGLTDMQDPACK